MKKMGTTPRWLALALLPLMGCAAPPPCPEVPPPPAASEALPSPAPPPSAPEPVLPHWRDGEAKRRIVEFVTQVTDPSSPSYLEPADRVATFDNDGTLWSEQPLYFQFQFAVERVLEQLNQSPAPAWAKKPWAVLLKKEGPQALAKLDEKAIYEIAMTSEAGQSASDYRAAVESWLQKAKHPRFERPYSELTFLPMVELLGYLRKNGFKTFIVSGGSVWFMRAFAEKVYGIPPEQVVGTLGETSYAQKEGRGTLTSTGKFAFIDDGPGKPVGIDRAIGKLPVFVAGNSDGDREMLEYATSQGRPALGLIVHHDDAEREWAYDRASHVGKLDKALDQAASARWLVVSMKDDFSTVYAPAAAPLPTAEPPAP